MITGASSRIQANVILDMGPSNEGVAAEPIGEWYSGKLLTEKIGRKRASEKSVGEHYPAENVGINAVRHEKHFQRGLQTVSINWKKHVLIPKTCREGTTYSPGVSEKDLCQNQQCGTVNPIINLPFGDGLFYHLLILVLKWFMTDFTSSHCVLPLFLAVHNLETQLNCIQHEGGYQNVDPRNHSGWRGHLWCTFFGAEFRYNLTQHFLKCLAGSIARMLLVLVLIVNISQV